MSRSVKNRSLLMLRGWWLTMAGLIIVVWPVSAGTTYQVTLDTSGLNSADTWYLDYQLVASDLPSENSATLSNFTLGGGSYTANQVLSGSVSGSFPGQYILTDPPDLTVSSVSELLIAFVPGANVTFDLSYTNNFSNTGFPDTFSWAVEYCDPTSTTCTLPLSSGNTPTPIVSGFGASLFATLDGVDADAAPQPVAADDQFNNIIPVVSVLPPPNSTVPEPASGLLALVGSAGLVGASFARSRRKISRQTRQRK